MCTVCVLLRVWVMCLCVGICVYTVHVHVSRDVYMLTVEIVLLCYIYTISMYVVYWARNSVFHNDVIRSRNFLKFVRMIFPPFFRSCPIPNSESNCSEFIIQARTEWDSDFAHHNTSISNLKQYKLNSNVNKCIHMDMLTTIVHVMTKLRVCARRRRNEFERHERLVRARRCTWTWNSTITDGHTWTM